MSPVFPGQKASIEDSNGRTVQHVPDWTGKPSGSFSLDWGTESHDCGHPYDFHIPMDMPIEGKHVDFEF